MYTHIFVYTCTQRDTHTCMSPETPLSSYFKSAGKVATDFSEGMTSIYLFAYLFVFALIF